MSTKIIDIHAHIYPDEIASKAVANIKKFYGICTGYKDGTADSLVAISKQAGVVRVVVHSVATHPKQVVSINNYIADIARNNPFFVPFATLNPDMTSAEIIAEYERVKALGMHGIKLHPDCQRFEADGEKALALLGCLDGKLPVLLHTGDKRFGFSNPKRIIAAANRYPHIRFIAAHFGGYSEWEYAEDYAEVQNVDFDTSSSLAFLEPRRAREIIRTLGVDRFMFGSDYPMWSAVDEKERLAKLELTEDELDKIYYKNAAKLLGL